MKIILYISELEIFRLLGCYAAQIGRNLPTFRDNLLLLSLRKNRPPRMGPIVCPETSATYYQSTLPNMPEE